MLHILHWMLFSSFYTIYFLLHHVVKRLSLLAFQINEECFLNILFILTKICFKPFSYTIKYKKNISTIKPKINIHKFTTPLKSAFISTTYIVFTNINWSEVCRVRNKIFLLNPFSSLLFILQ